MPVSDTTTTAAAIDATHLARQREFSERTFGPGSRTNGVIDHIRKELLEIEADPADLGEWVDVIILAFDGAWRAGHGPQQIIDAIVAKQARNEARIWPDWRTAEPGKAIEHDRSADIALRLEEVRAKAENTMWSWSSDQAETSTRPKPLDRPCANPAVHAEHPQEITGVHRECAGRRVPFCEPCAMGYSCPAHDPREGDTAPSSSEGGADRG